MGPASSSTLGLRHFSQTRLRPSPQPGLKRDNLQSQAIPVIIPRIGGRLGLEWAIRSRLIYKRPALPSDSVFMVAIWGSEDDIGPSKIYSCLKFQRAAGRWLALSNRLPLTKRQKPVCQTKPVLPSPLEASHTGYLNV